METSVKYSVPLSLVVFIVALFALRFDDVKVELGRKLMLRALSARYYFTILIPTPSTSFYCSAGVLAHLYETY